MSGPDLPAGVAAALDALLEGRPRAALTDSARRLSEGYRARRPTEETIRSETDALAYALTRMPATYAAAIAALERLRRARPDLAPASLLDVGCGLGAAAYAGATLWPAMGVTLLDRSRAFLDLARRLAAQSGVAPVASAAVLEADLTRLEPPAAHDLVVAAYALTELPDDALGPLLATLWRSAGHALVIVEPGTPRDYARLMTARTQLCDAGAVVLAPCPHSAPCPMTAPDWCHFATRLNRRREHRLLKQAEAPFEDEKFCYLVLARAGAPEAARILAPPRVNKAGAALKLCMDKGIGETFIPKRDKPRYDNVRRKGWGDAIAASPEETE